MQGSHYLGLVGLLPIALAATPYSQYILAPSTRVLSPLILHQANGSVSNAAGVTTSGSASTIFGTGSAATYDYGKNIGGLVSFAVSSTSDAEQYIGIAFTESSEWISPDGSDATQNIAIDETIWTKVTGPGNYSLTHEHNRGGFRYLNVYHNTTGTVSLSSLTTYFNAMPHLAANQLRDYTGYFHVDDNDKLNRVWYASAYTDQLCTIPSDEGNSLVNLDDTNATVPTFWYANATLTNGTSALVDGAKRDKLIWPGDFGISVPGVFLSTNDAITIKLSLEQLFRSQNATTGQMPWVADVLYANPPDTFSGSSVYSFTYHLHSLLGLGNYYIYTGDIDFLELQWGRVKHAIDFSLRSVDDTGLAYVPEDGSADWLRYGMGAYNIEANSILVYTLKMLVQLSYALNDTTQVANWTSYAANITTAANAELWSSELSMYTDNTTTTLTPQDGNSWAIISGVATPSRASQVSKQLSLRWGPYGAPAPEAGTTVSPFASGWELQAHMLAGHPERAVDLVEFMWCDFMLDDPRMTNSTFLEGYNASGALHYPAYTDDARISHAHGWSTGPIIALTNYLAGLHVLNASAWVIHPQVGNLTAGVHAGFEITTGSFSSDYEPTCTDGVDGTGSYGFVVPDGTTGTIIIDIPDCDASITLSDTNGYSNSHNVPAFPDNGTRDAGVGWWGPSLEGNGTGAGTVRWERLKGGNWNVTVSCT